MLNSKLETKNELEQTIEDTGQYIAELGRLRFNAILDEMLVNKGWERQDMVFGDPGGPSVKMDFMKDRVGVGVEFGHPSFIGIDLIKFQMSAYSGIDKINVGVYVVTTRSS